MEEQPEIIVGLDIGTTKIAALVGRKVGYNKIEILGMGKAESVGVTRGVVSHITPTVDAIRKAVEEAEAKSGVDIRYVNVGIAGQHIKSLQHRGIRMRNSVDDEIAQIQAEIMKEKERMNGITPQEKHAKLVKEVCNLSFPAYEMSYRSLTLLNRLKTWRTD